LISGNGETTSRLLDFSLFLPGTCPNNRDRRTGTAFLSNSFLVQCGLIGAVSLLKSRRIKHLIVAATTELVVRRALPFNERI